MSTVYDMYPSEWGPRRHRREPPDPHTHRDGAAAVQSAVQEAMDRRDNGGPRPDDN